LGALIVVENVSLVILLPFLSLPDFFKDARSRPMVATEP
jgi:hypothetical protein